MSKNSNGRPAKARTHVAKRARSEPFTLPDAGGPMADNEELRRLGVLCVTLGQKAELLEGTLLAQDRPRAKAHYDFFFRLLIGLDRMLKTRWGGGPVGFSVKLILDAGTIDYSLCTDLMTLLHRWDQIKKESGLENVDLTNLGTVVSRDLHVDLFWPGHEAVYRAFVFDAIRLLEGIGGPLELLNDFVIPFEAGLGASAYTLAAPSENGRATEGNGTGATNDQDIDPDGWKFLLALDDLGAWSREDSQVRNAILNKAGINRHPRSAKLLAMVADLKRIGLMEASTGPVCSWLTPKGRELVAIYRNGRATNAINK
jgi:hypothetical protein